jgi:hypothetical protein
MGSTGDSSSASGCWCRELAREPCVPTESQPLQRAARSRNYGKVVSVCREGSTEQGDSVSEGDCVFRVLCEQLHGIACCRRDEPILEAVPSKDL